MTTTEQLQAKAAAAEEQARKAREQIAAREAEAEAERQRRALERDRALLDSYDDAALEQAVEEAKRAFEKAVAQTPLVSAYADLAATVALRRERFYQAVSAADRLNRAGEQVRPPSIEPPTWWGDFLDSIKQAASRAASAQIADTLDAIEDGE